MTEDDQPLAAEAAWPVLEACLLAGLADDPERLAHAVERIVDLAPDDDAGGLTRRVNEWLVRFRYTFRLVREDDEHLHAESDGPPGRQLRWPISGQVVEVTPTDRPGVDGLVRLHLVEPDGCRLVVETSACETWEPGEWVTVTGQLAAQIVDGAVVIRSPTPTPSRRLIRGCPGRGGRTRLGILLAGQRQARPQCLGNGLLEGDLRG